MLAYTGIAIGLNQNYTIVKRLSQQAEPAHDKCLRAYLIYNMLSIQGP